MINYFEMTKNNPLYFLETEKTISKLIIDNIIVYN